MCWKGKGMVCDICYMVLGEQQHMKDSRNTGASIPWRVGLAREYVTQPLRNAWRMADPLESGR